MKIYCNISTKTEKLLEFRLRDYFDKIDLITSQLSLVFQIKESVNSDWKMLVVHIIEEIRKKVPGSEIEIVPAYMKNSQSESKA